LNVTAYECPMCKKELKQTDRFCSQCGLEVKMDCPACGEDERLWLATIDHSTERCANHNIYLYACEKCGRWYLPGVRQCEDPSCKGSVRSPSPSLSGRRWDGRGRTLSFDLPASWLGSTPALNEREWKFPGLHATLYAHDRIYAWHQGSLSYQNLLNDTPSKLYPLPGNVIPHGKDLLCLFGGAVILAGSSEFLAVDLGLNNDLKLYECEPLAQAANFWWWVAWGEKDGKRVLLLAAVTGQWDIPDLQEVEAPEDAEITPGGRIVMNDHSAYWIGKDNAIWRLSLEGGIVEQAAKPLAVGKRRDIWADKEVPGSLCDNRGVLEFILEPSQKQPYGKTVQTGIYVNCNDFFLDEEYLWIIGRKIGRYPQGDGFVPNAHMDPPVGIWVSGCIAENRGKVGGKKLVTLIKDTNITRISVVDISAGTAPILWQTDNIEPKGLFAVNNCLYMYHQNGLIELREARK